MKKLMCGRNSENELSFMQVRKAGELRGVRSGYRNVLPNCMGLIDIDSWQAVRGTGKFVFCKYLKRGETGWRFEGM
jgi:hypothetical protein